MSTSVTYDTQIPLQNRIIHHELPLLRHGITFGRIVINTIWNEGSYGFVERIPSSVSGAEVFGEDVLAIEDWGVGIL